MMDLGTLPFTKVIYVEIALLNYSRENIEIAINIFKNGHFDIDINVNNFLNSLFDIVINICPLTVILVLKPDRRYRLSRG